MFDMIRGRNEELDARLKQVIMDDLIAVEILQAFNERIIENGCVRAADVCQWAMDRKYDPQYVDYKLGWDAELRFDKMFKPVKTLTGPYAYRLNLPKIKEL